MHTVSQGVYPEVVPRIKVTEAEAPDDALPALEALVSMAPEEQQTSPGVALACVGMRADFEVHPQLSELTPPLPKDLEELWPEPVQATVALARAYVRDLSLDGVLKELCRPPSYLLRDSDRTIRFYTTCFKRGFQLEAWLFNVLLMYHLRTHCSFTLVMREEDLDSKDLFASFSEAMRPLIEIGYATLHMAYAMPHWSSSMAKKHCFMVL